MLLTFENATFAVMCLKEMVYRQSRKSGERNMYSDCNQTKADCECHEKTICY